MSGPARAIRTVIVVGGGLVGWSAAAALRRRLPWLDVSIVARDVPASALSDTMPCSLPSIVGFHGDLGLSDQDAVLRTRSSYRLGTLFSGWAPKQGDYFHSYDTHGRAFGAVSFHLHWARMGAGGKVGRFDRQSPAAALALAGRFSRSAGPQDPIFSGMEYGLHLDVARYRDMMRTFALHCGVREHRGALAAVELREGGMVDRVRMDDGAAHAGDLYIDASGPEACLRGAIDSEREDWSGLLPCDRLLSVQAPRPADLLPYDTVTTTPTGWRWTAASMDLAHQGLCYSSSFCDDATASRQLRVASGLEPTAPSITIATGTLRAPWRGNCVAIGDAATAIEPLEWGNLHLAHSAIDRVISMIPGTDFAPVELAEYNRQTYAEAIRVRDFVLMHYATSARTEPFWRAAARTTLPPSLAHTLELFRERGRLPVYEEETFARDSWLSVLYGQGVMPRRVDPLAEVMPEAEVADVLSSWRGAINAALPKIPMHAEYVAAQLKQLAR